MRIPDNPLINKLLKEPLSFSNKDIDDFISFYVGNDEKILSDLAFEDLRYCLRKVYDINEVRLVETSNANGGGMGFFNRISTNRRKIKYYKRVRKQKENKKYIKIYSEGDSWFQFPFFIKDITDWLLKKKEYLIYSDAYAGDWITNIIYEGQYVEGLSVHDPDVFLLSGGGNDFLGGHRLALMVNNRVNQQEKYKNAPDLAEYNISEELQNKILAAQKHITKEFYSFLLIIEIQYTILFKQLYSSGSKFGNLITITQGYAYPYPHKGIRFSLRYPLRPFVNKVAGSGRWLFEPLMLKGITNKELQHSIVTTLLFELNNTLIRIANKFTNVHFMDNRKLEIEKKDWYDELHLKGYMYKKIAKEYDRLIKDKMNF